jgi:DNA topoisomerase IA
MTEQEIIGITNQTSKEWLKESPTPEETANQVPKRFLEIFAKLVAEKERESLEVELLKLKQGVASKSDYIQGRWDLIGEFQDIIRASSKT